MSTLVWEGTTDSGYVHFLFVYNTGVTLTHISLASFLCDIGEQCRPSSDAAKSCIQSGSPLFAYIMFY